MGRDSVEKIDVQGKPIGIVGLTGAIEEVARHYAESPREIVEKELLVRLSVKNYIPDRARPQYGKVFVREFNKFMGRPYDKERADGVTITILGPGCYQCNELERNVIDAVAEMGVPASVEHVMDIKKIGEYGVMGTPALVVNGQVRSVGRIASKAEIRQLLRESLKDEEN